jgi:hypothetical protein
MITVFGTMQNRSFRATNYDKETLVLNYLRCLQDGTHVCYTFATEEEHREYAAALEKVLSAAELGASTHEFAGPDWRAAISLVSRLAGFGPPLNPACERCGLPLLRGQQFCEQHANGGQGA